MLLFKTITDILQTDYYLHEHSSKVDTHNGGEEGRNYVTIRRKLTTENEPLLNFIRKHLLQDHFLDSFMRYTNPVWAVQLRFLIFLNLIKLAVFFSKNAVQIK